tara:strand:- start:1174 stop:1461 length:288 start_codon:yes stop_codon:yes gene_type:complete
MKSLNKHTEPLSFGSLFHLTNIAWLKVAGAAIILGDNMIKIKVEYTIEIPEHRLDKYCKLARIGRKQAKKLLREMAAVFGRVHTYEYIDEVIEGK